MFLTLPDLLTCARGVFALGAIFVVFAGVPYLYEILLVLFVLGAVTDYADGVIARSWSLVSDFGKVFDPLFDKVLVFVYLVILYPTGTIPELVILIVIVRDLVIDALRSSYAGRGVVIPAVWSAKAKTSVIFLAIISALVELVIPSSMVHYATLVLSYAGLSFALISAWSYGSIFFMTEKKLSAHSSTSSNT